MFSSFKRPGGSSNIHPYFLMLQLRCKDLLSVNSIHPLNEVQSRVNSITLMLKLVIFKFLNICHKCSLHDISQFQAKRKVKSKVKSIAASKQDAYRYIKRHCTPI